MAIKEAVRCSQQEDSLRMASVHSVDSSRISRWRAAWNARCLKTGRLLVNGRFLVKTGVWHQSGRCSKCV